MMELYSARNSCGFAALICLEETGARYGLTNLSFAEGEQRQARYLSLNPHAMVPALTIEGVVVTELIAILTYIADQDPGTLIPVNALARAKVYEALAWFSTSVHVAIAQIFRGERFSADVAARPGIAARGRAKFIAAADEFEEMAAGGPWLAGEAFTAVDAVAAVAWRWVERLELDQSTYPQWSATMARVFERPAVRRALAIEASDAPTTGLAGASRP